MAIKEGLSYFLTKVAICILLRIGVNEKLYCYLTKSSSAAGRTRLWLGNTSTCTQRAFWHIARLSTAAGCPRRWLGNTNTCLQRAFWRLIMTLLDIETHVWASTCVVEPTFTVLRPVVGDHFVIYENAHVDKCLYCQANA